VDISNVALVCPHCNKPTRVGYRVGEDGSKSRICRKCEEAIE
jgi:large subunit ribosomal protein L24